jgi:hypothetical protein
MFAGGASAPAADVSDRFRETWGTPMTTVRNHTAARHDVLADRHLAPLSIALCAALAAAVLALALGSREQATDPVQPTPMSLIGP